ncbi:MAG: hypothetical protein Q9204_004258 [Flavoplaca sp. TL-2023a]
MPTSPPDGSLIKTNLDTKAEPLDFAHLKSEGDWKRMEKSGGKEEKKRARELPPEIIEHILYLTDPETFASLILVNHAWRAASQTPHLYAYHLSRCPSFSITNNVVAGPFTENSLPRLKRQFVREVKRNLFEAYLRPRQTILSLTSSTTSCSASFPGGEAFDFAFSPNGVWTLALSSSRIYVLDTLSCNISVLRELKVLRRPVSAAILDDGTILAVLSTDRRVNVYDLSNRSVKYLRAVTLDNPPHTITLSPKGEVLAAAYDGGIELHSLAINALTTERRSVKCDYIDSLAFSKDGTMLLGTTQHSINPSTVVLSAPFYDETNQELPAKDVLSHMWTSQILFPNSSRDCSHATLLPDHTEGDANWTCTYDRVFESFRAVRTDDLRNGTTYFTGPKRRIGATPKDAKTKLTPCTLPATTGHGDLVAAGFLGKDVWLYGVPESLETSTVEPTPESTTSTRQNSTGSTGRSPAASHSRRRESAEFRRLPQWQVLVDKNRNVLVKGRKIAEVPGVTGVKWVEQEHLEKGSRSVAERLLVSAPGGVSEPSDIDEEGFASVDGGRLIVLDFDRGLSDGKIHQVHFEVGTVEPEMLEEQDMDIDAEVDIIRRRTTRQRIGHGIGTSVADALASAPELPTQAAMAAALSNAEAPAVLTDDPLIPRATGRRNVPASPVEGLSLEEASQVFDGPYSHSQPRSRTSLYRSATAVAANRQRNPPRIPLPDSGQIRYRRPDGRGELPHESDADNWVPPPPMYTPKPERPLPDYLRQTLAPSMPRQNAFERRRSRSAERPRRASTVHESPSIVFPQRRISSSPERPTYLHDRQDTISTLDSSDRQSNRIGSVSPTSTMGFTFPTAESETSSSSQHTSPSSAHRRPVSAFVGRFRAGHRKSLTARLTSPISPMPLEGTDERRLSGSVRSVSLPSSPIRSGFQTHRSPNRLTLSGANLQSRLEYPLPPAPEESDTPTPTRPQTSPFGGSSRKLQNQTTIIPAHELTTIPNLPSAEQLANLHNRYCHAPTPTPQTMNLPPSVRTSLDTHPPPSTNRPPRAALGAAGGSPISPFTERRRLSIAQRNSFAASSPALLRPTPHRLDTIQSISSIISQQPSRSNSRDVVRGGKRIRRRSRSAGPGVQVKSGAEGKRKWFGTKKGRKGRGGEVGSVAPVVGSGGGGSAYLENSRMLNERLGVQTAVEKEKEKDGKCVVM